MLSVTFPDGSYVLALCWIKEVEKATSIDDLETSRSISGPNFEMLDARIATDLRNIISNTNFKRKVNISSIRKLRKRTDAHVGDKLLS